MKTYIELFRGIKVGGKNILPMKELRSLLENMGMQNVTTYIQSGNVVFRCNEQTVSQLSGRIGTKIEKSCGLKLRVLFPGIEKSRQAMG